MERARQPHQKEARREAILAAGLEALAEAPFQEITMARIAGRAGLAKGTLYLYFATKEELFLEVLRRQLHAWFWDLESGMEGLARTGRTAAIARLLAESAASRPSLRALLAVLPALLEHNLPEATALAFRHELLAGVVAMGSMLERSLGFLEPGQGARLLLWVQAEIIGLQALAEPAPAVRRMLAQADLAPLRMDFATELQRSIRFRLAGQRLAGKAHGK